MDYKSWDLSELEAMWERRSKLVEEAKRNINTTGMTRPRRDPAERKFLEERGRLGPFIETDIPFAYPRRRGPDPAPEPDSGGAGKDPAE
ncbi:MAG TPA: hypothetical protein VK399_10545 [Longimicrobiaceae bacterium]|nr:hypothetical protein [Longimicrobiaceae bacterium]